MIHLIVCEAIPLLCVVFHPINGNNKSKKSHFDGEMENFLSLKGLQMKNDKFMQSWDEKHERKCRCSWRFALTLLRTRVWKLQLKLKLISRKLRSRNRSSNKSSRVFKLQIPKQTNFPSPAQNFYDNFIHIFSVKLQ